MKIGLFARGPKAFLNRARSIPSTIVSLKEVPMRYPHIVFDIDNTLIDTTAAVLHSLQKALREVTGSTGRWGS